MNRMANLGAALIAATSIFLGGCSDAPKENASPLSLLASPAAPTGKFLHLSDIHFDVFKSTIGGDVSVLADLPVDQWDQHLDAKAAPSSGKVDTNYALLVSTLTEAQTEAPFDFILYTGDYLPHDFSDEFRGNDKEAAAFAAKIVDFVNYKISQAFPGKPIVGMLGNNDSGCGDYNLQPGGDFLADLAPDMPAVNSNPTAAADFAKYGYYAIKHPTVPNTDFIVLSTYWSHKYPLPSGHCSGSPKVADPGQDQADWLGKAIGSATRSPSPSPSPRNAILLMHIPPGIDGYSGGGQWHDRFETSFENKLTTASHTILGAFAGHSHMDEFRVLSNSAGPYLAVRIAPAVTTKNGNAPSFTVTNYDTKTGAMTDYTVHSLRPRDGGSVGWQPEYSFSDAYGPGGFAPTRLAQLAARIQDNSDTSGARNNYLRYYRANNSPLRDPQASKQVICATSNDDAQSFQSCVSTVN